MSLRHGEGDGAADRLRLALDLRGQRERPVAGHRGLDPDLVDAALAGALQRPRRGGHRRHAVRPHVEALSNTTASGTGLPSGTWTSRTLTAPALPVGGGGPAGSKR